MKLYTKKAYNWWRKINNTTQCSFDVDHEFKLILWSRIVQKMLIAPARRTSLFFRWIVTLYLSYNFSVGLSKEIGKSCLMSYNFRPIWQAPPTIPRAAPVGALPNGESGTDSRCGVGAGAHRGPRLSKGRRSHIFCGSIWLRLTRPPLSSLCPQVAPAAAAVDSRRKG